MIQGTKPEPGSKEEFHNAILNQIERFRETQWKKIGKAIPPTYDLVEELTRDIAGNLWYFVQEAQGNSAPRQLAFTAMEKALDRLLEATGGCDFHDDANDDIPESCPGLVDPYYGAECAWCEANTARAQAKAAQ